MSCEFEFEMEQLEKREMKAGDVSTSVTGGGDLILTGDNQDNEVAVIATGNPGEFEIKGLNGTTVDGQASVTVQNVTDDMRVNLRNGDNAIIMTNRDEDGNESDFQVDDIRFRSRTGNDIVFLQGVEMSGQFRAQTAAGDDIVAVSGSSMESMLVRSGGGNDVLLVAEIDVAGTTNASLGSGSDALMTAESDYHGVANFNMGSGADFATSFGDEYHSDLNLNGGGGLDAMLLPGAGDLSTVAGNDNVVGFEGTQTESGFNYLFAAAAVLNSHVRATDFEVLFEDFIE